MADLEPQEESAVRPVKPVPPRERFLGEVEFAPVPVAVSFNVRLVAPQRRRCGLHRQRYLAAAIAPQMRVMPDQPRIARDKTGAQAGGARPLRQRMKHDNILKIVAERGAGFERSGRRRAVVDLGVALVDRQDKIVFARQPDRLLQIIEARDRALRVGRRAQIKQRGAFEGRARDRRPGGGSAASANRRWRGAIPACRSSADIGSTYPRWPPMSPREAAAADVAARPKTSGSADR